MNHTPKIAIFLSTALISILLIACGANETNLKISKDKHAAEALSIARQNGCLNCHSIGSSIIGPAWVLVSERYKASTDAREMLINKVRTGGNGSWNEITGGALMPPQTRVSREHISLIVDFILSLKKEEGK